MTIVEALPHLVAARGRGLLEAVWSARSASAASASSSASRSRRSSAPTRASRSPSPAARPSRPSCCWSRSVAARSRPTSGTRSRASPWTAASSSTDERLRTNVPGVYAVGDIVPGLQLAHRGFQQGIFVAEEIAGLNPVPIDEIGIPRVTYCDPEVASVGLTEAKAAARSTAPTRSRPSTTTCRQRQEPDPQDRRLRQAGPGKDGPVVGVHMVGRPGRRARRRGSADLQLGSVPGRGRPARPRPPHPDRGSRRGAPRAGRQAAARPRLTSRSRRSRRHVQTIARPRSPTDAGIGHHARGSARASPRAPSPAGSSRRATASRSTSRCSRSRPTRSTPRSRRPPPAC